MIARKDRPSMKHGICCITQRFKLSISFCFNGSLLLSPLHHLLTVFFKKKLGVMQDYFDRQIFRGTVDSTELSFVGTIGFAFCGLMGPVTPFFMSYIGARWVLFFGTVLMSAGLILASFSTQVWQLYITQSVMHGMGAALLYIVSLFDY